MIWEVEELTLRKIRPVLIGEYSCVLPLAAGDATVDDRTALRARLAALLHGHEVLAYTTDPAGLSRFARALRSVLLERG